MTRRRRALAVAALAVGVVTITDALVISQGDSEAKAKKVYVAEIRPPSTMPRIKPEAMKPTAEGAAAFALYWFDALNYSLSHGDTDLLAHWTNAGCRQCNGYLIGIADWKSDGTKVEGGLSYPQQLSIGPFSTTQPVPFVAEFLTSAAQLTKADGTVQRYPGGRTQGGLSLVWEHGRWQMNELILDRTQAEAAP